MRLSNCNITPGTNAQAAVLSDFGDRIPVALIPDPNNPARCSLEFPDAPWPNGPIGLNLTVMASGYQPFTGRVTLPPYGGIEEGTTIELKAGIPPFPSRAEACSIQCHFQGAYVNSQAYGAAYQAVYGGPGQIPYFGAAFADFAQAGDLNQILDQLIALGDSHVMHLCGNNDHGYNEDGQPYGVNQIVLPCNSWAQMATYLACADAIIQRGKFPMYTLDGEGSPDWIKANFESWVAQMRVGYDRLRFGPIVVAFDGVWPAAWTPQQMMDMIPWMRSIVGPDAYLGFFFGNGPSGNPYLWVNDESDYTQPWCDGLDIVLTTSGLEEALGVSMANKAQYMVTDPNFSEFQPSFHGPFVFVPNSRGARYWGNIEWATYQTVRDPNQNYKTMCDTERQQMRTMNVPCAG